MAICYLNEYSIDGNAVTFTMTACQDTAQRRLIKTIRKMSKGYKTRFLAQFKNKDLLRFCERLRDL